MRNRPLSGGKATRSVSLMQTAKLGVIEPNSLNKIALAEQALQKV
jgi:hypothetical protein